MSELALPLAYRWLCAHEFVVLLPWHFMEASRFSVLRDQYQLETGRDIWPIAYRQDCDDFAGFEIVDGRVMDTVITTHPSWAKSNHSDWNPDMKKYPDVLSWIQDCVFPATREFMTEEDLEDVVRRQQTRHRLQRLHNDA